MSDMNGKKSNFLRNYCLKNDLSFLSFDFRGHGKSSGKIYEFGVEDWFNDLSNIINFLNIKNITLIGSSLGGWVAMSYALSNPSKIKKLIGLAPAPDFTERLIWNNLNELKKKSISSGKIIEEKISKDFSYFYSKQLFERSKKKIIKKSKKKYKGETIIFNGFKDKSVSFKYNNNLLETLHFENLTSIILKNADHSLSDQNSLKTILKFI